MLVAGAIVPHSPLLIPRIGKEKRDTLSATIHAYADLEERLYALGVETLVIISPHATAYGDAFSANIAESYVGTMKSFGDHETSVRIRGDLLVLDRLQSALRTKTNIPFTLTTSEDLDYGFTVPLFLFPELQKRIRLIPISPSLLGAQAHADFGRALKDVLHENRKRIAVIASADLSHKLTETSPGGFSVEGPAFDSTIRGKIHTMDVNGLLSMDQEAVDAAGQCGYRPILITTALFEHMNVSVRELSYEAPFGVGYLTALIEPA